jgi:phage major head subunit gpT-like protein
MPNLRAAIKRIASRSAVVNSNIHVVAVSSLAHARDHGDWTPAALLLNALPSGQRVKALAFWFKRFSNGKLSFHKADDGWKGKLAKERNVADFDIEGAMAVTFGDLTAEKKPDSVLTTEALVKILAKRAEKTEFDDTGEKRVATRAAIVLAATLARAAQDVMNSEEFAALKAEERAILDAAKAAAPSDGETAKPAQPAEIVELIEALSSRRAA